MNTDAFMKCLHQSIQFCIYFLFCMFLMLICYQYFYLSRMRNVWKVYSLGSNNTSQIYPSSLIVLGPQTYSDTTPQNLKCSQNRLNFLTALF